MEIVVWNFTRNCFSAFFSDHKLAQFLKLIIKNTAWGSHSAGARRELGRVRQISNPPSAEIIFFISDFEKFCEFAKVTDVFKQLIVLTTVS